MLQAVLGGAQGTADIRDVVDGGADGIHGGGSAFLGADVHFLDAQGVGVDVLDVDLHLVEVLGGIADLQGQGRASFLEDGGLGGGAVEYLNLAFQAAVKLGQVGIAGIGGPLVEDEAGVVLAHLDVEHLVVLGGNGQAVQGNAQLIGGCLVSSRCTAGTLTQVLQVAEVYHLHVVAVFGLEHFIALGEDIILIANLNARAILEDIAGLIETVPSVASSGSTTSIIIETDDRFGVNGAGAGAAFLDVGGSAVLDFVHGVGERNFSGISGISAVQVAGSTSIDALVVHAEVEVALEIILGRVGFGRFHGGIVAVVGHLELQLIPIAGNGILNARTAPFRLDIHLAAVFVNDLLDGGGNRLGGNAFAVYGGNRILQLVSGNGGGISGRFGQKQAVVFGLISTSSRIFRRGIGVQAKNQVFKCCAGCGAEIGAVQVDGKGGLAGASGFLVVTDAVGRSGAGQFQATAVGGAAGVSGGTNCSTIFHLVVGVVRHGQAAENGFGGLTQAIGVHGAVQQLDAVEVGGVCNAVDFRLELLHFLLELGAVGLVVIGAVGGLGGQRDHAVEHVVDFLHGAFSGLYQGDAVLGVLLGGLQAGDLGAHLLGNGQAGGVIAGAVDLVAGRELLQVLGDGGSIDGVVAVGVHRRDVVLDSHFIASFQ